MSSNCLVAGTGNADDLTSVIDSRSGAGGVAGEQRQFVDLVSSQVPDDGPELEDLRGYAGRVTSRIFRPPDYLPPVVGAGGKAVIAPQRGERLHYTVLPHKPKTGISGIVRPREERRATPFLSQRLRRGGLGDAHDNAPVIFHGPCHITVRSAECAEVLRQSISPQGGMPALVSWQIGIARHPAAVIDTIAYASRSSQ